MRHGRWTDARFGSKADIGLPAIDVCYSPKSGHPKWPASLHLPRLRFFRRLSPFPFASLPVVAGDTALDHFFAPAVACDDEAREVSAAEANRAERNRNENLAQQLAFHGSATLSLATNSGGLTIFAAIRRATLTQQRGFS
jgi:hypothetical protein